MKILDRYIGRTVVQASLVTLLILLALNLIFSFIAQLDDVNERYTLGRAFLYVLLTMPRYAYELFPTAVLLGSLVGLGNLGSSSELVVMRAAGISLYRIVWAVMKGGLILLLLAVALGELAVPPSEQSAQVLRSTARSGFISLQGRDGFWAREGSRIVHIQQARSGTRLLGISIFEYDADWALRSLTYAESAYHQHGKWWLQNLKRSHVSRDGVRSETLGNTGWDALFNPETIGVLTVDPEDLSARALWDYVNYLKRNRTDYERYALAFWIKVISPLASLVMLIVAVPFVFGPLRSTSTGVRLLVGVLVGVGFFLLNQTINQLGLVYGLAPFASAALPSILFAAAGLYALARVR